MYVTIFRNRKRADMDAAAYSADAGRMEALASQVPGFLSIKSFHADDGEVVTISEWESEAAAKEWGRHPEHMAVQAKGRSDYYQSYASFAVIDPVVRRFEKGE